MKISEAEILEKYPVREEWIVPAEWYDDEITRRKKIDQLSVLTKVEADGKTLNEGDKIYIKNETNHRIAVIEITKVELRMEKINDDKEKSKVASYQRTVIYEDILE